jgi:hypothetical protein
MSQTIIDLDRAVPERLSVRVEGEIFDLPGDIPIPDFIEIERLSASLTEPAEDGPSPTDLLEALNDKMLELFQIHQPDVEKLPLGPRRLGHLIPQLYAGAAESDGGDENRPPKGGTRSMRKPPKRSRSSRS